MNQATLLSESGLYKFVMRSEKTLARPFQDWVTREVLPSIRKTGTYAKSIGGDHQKLTSADTNHSMGHPMRMTTRLGAAR